MKGVWSGINNHNNNNKLLSQYTTLLIATYMYMSAKTSHSKMWGRKKPAALQKIRRISWVDMTNGFINTLSTSHFQRKALSAQGTFSASHFQRKPLSAQATFSASHFQRKPLSAQATFSSSHFQRKLETACLVWPWPEPYVRHRGNSRRQYGYRKSFWPEQGGQHVAVRCNQTELPLSPTARYLGVTLDAAVKWDPHVDAMAKKVVQKIGALWRFRRCLSLSSRIQYVRSVIMPDLLYGSNAFSSSLKVSQFDRLQVLQNRAARAVYGLPPQTSAQPLLERMSLYRVRECYAQKRLVLVWRCVNGKASSVLQDLFSPSAGSTTRHQVSRGLTVPSAQSEAGRSRLAFQAALAWNARPRSVREIKAAQQFKLASIPYTLQWMLCLTFPVHTPRHLLFSACLCAYELFVFPLLTLQNRSIDTAKSLCWRYKIAYHLPPSLPPSLSLSLSLSP